MRCEFKASLRVRLALLIETPGEVQDHFRILLYDTILLTC